MTTETSRTKAPRGPVGHPGSRVIGRKYGNNKVDGRMADFNDIYDIQTSDKTC